MAEKNIEDKLSDIGGLISGISEAVKVSKSLKDKNLDIKKIIECTKEQADKVNEFEIPDNPLLTDLKPPLEDVKTASQGTAASASQLEICADSLCKDVEFFSNIVRSFLRDKDPLILKDVRGSLINVHENSKNLAAKCNDFFEQLQKTKEMVAVAIDKINKKHDELIAKKESETERVIEAIKGLALKWYGETVRGIGKITNSENVSDYGAGKMQDGGEKTERSNGTASRNDELSKLAGRILKEAEKLKIVAKGLEKCEVTLAALMQETGSKEKALEIALKFLERDLKTSDELVEIKLEVEKKDAEIAKGKENVESLIAILKAQRIPIPSHLNLDQEDKLIKRTS